MAFYGYKGDIGECYWTPYRSTYDYEDIPPQESLSNSPYISMPEPNFIVHDQTYDCYNSSATQSHLYYSAYNYSEPRLIQYDPASYHTKFVISYSEHTSEFNETNFEEYDPTPYDGGYDQVQTYGKPLSPSKEICYPRSTPAAHGVSLDGFSYASIPSPYGNDDNDHLSKTDNPSENTDIIKEGKDGDETGSAIEKSQEMKPGKNIDSNKDSENQQNDHDNGDGNGRVRGFGYGHENQVQHVPYGSGLETLDICESIFGYWPCLAKMEQKRIVSTQDVSDEDVYWKSASDYLFGSPFGYGNQPKDGGYGDLVYGYESYHQW